MFQSRTSGHNQYNKIRVIFNKQLGKFFFITYVQNSKCIASGIQRTQFGARTQIEIINLVFFTVQNFQLSEPGNIQFVQARACNLHIAKFRISCQIQRTERLLVPVQDQSFQIRTPGNINRRKIIVFTGNLPQFRTIGNIQILYRALVKIQLFQIRIAGKIKNRHFISSDIQSHKIREKLKSGKIRDVPIFCLNIDSVIIASIVRIRDRTLIFTQISISIDIDILTYILSELRIRERRIVNRNITRIRTNHRLRCFLNR